MRWLGEHLCAHFPHRPSLGIVNHGKKDVNEGLRVRDVEVIFHPFYLELLVP